MRVFVYKGEGMYGMGSMVTLTAPDHAEAFWTIKTQLKIMGLPDESNLKNIKDNTVSYPVSTAKVICTDNGDY